MADFNRDYHPTNWSSASLSPANLNNIEGFMTELDDRTKDLKSDKLDKTSNFATRAETAATSAQASATSAASSATSAAASAQEAKSFTPTGYDALVQKVNGLSTVATTGSYSDLINRPALSNSNLLDNPFFTVNQRGATSYTSGYNYCLDRWKIESSTGTVTLNDNGISLVGEIRQYCETERIANLLGKKITISMMFSDGDVAYKTLTLPATMPTGYMNLGGTSKNGITIQFRFLNGTKFYLTLSGTSTVNIRATKVELGEVSTLANDVAPNHAEELAKCQYYYQRIAVNSITSDMPLGIATMVGKTAFCPMNLIRTMRVAPTVTMSAYGNFVLYYSGNAQDLTSITCSISTENSVTIKANVVNSLTSNTCGVLSMRPNTITYIAFSADL